MTIFLAPQEQQRATSEFDREFERADMKRATQHWEECSIKQFVGNGGIPRPLDKNFERKELGKYSTGFQLYFKFIQTFMIFFGICCIPAVYLIYSNSEGAGYIQIKSPFDSLTLGNQVDYTYLPLVLLTSGYSAWKQQIDTSTKVLTIHQYIDLGITIFAIVVYVFYRYSSSKEKEEIDTYNCNTSDYAIEVEGIPSKGVTELEVATHFGMLFGSVNQCKFARDYQGTMLYFEDIAELQSEKKRHEAKIRLNVSKDIKRVGHLENKIEKLRRYVAKKLKDVFGERILSHNDYPAVKAFVLFDSLVSQNRALRTYGKHQSTSIYKTIFCCKSKSVPKKFKLLGKHNIKVTQADEPTNIKWENQDTGKCEFILRFLVVYFIVLLCLVFTFLFIIASNVLSYRSQITAQETAQNSVCGTLSIGEIFSSPALVAKCNEYLRARAIQIVTSVLSGFCVVMINFIIKQIFISLARFQRYETLSRESTATLVKYFFSLFLNTAVIPILANSNIYGFQLSKNIVQLIIKDTSGLVENSYPADFDRFWYSQVGGKIMSTMLIAVFSPHLVDLLLIPCKRCRMRSKAKNAVFQKDLNKIFTPPEFKISFYYSIVLNIFFVSFVFAAGMPLLYITSFFAYLMINYSEKYIVARFCHKPPGYDNAQNKLMIKAIPFAIVLHCAFSIWMFGCDKIFPYDPSLFKWSKNFNDNSGVLIRMERSFPQAVVLFVILLFIILDTFIWPIFVANSEKEEKESQAKIENKMFGTFRQEYRRLSQLGLATYNMKINPRYHDIISAMQLDLDDDQNDQEEGDSNSTDKRLMAAKEAQKAAKPNQHKVQPEGPAPGQMRKNKVAPT